MKPAEKDEELCDAFLRAVHAICLEECRKNGCENVGHRKTCQHCEVQFMFHTAYFIYNAKRYGAFLALQDLVISSHPQNPLQNY